MLFNYYKIALRHLRNIYSLINLSGLTIGLTVFILIFLWVDDELSFDRFHAGHDRISRVVYHRVDVNANLLWVAVTPPMLCDYLKTNFAEIESACRVSPLELFLRHEEKAFYQKGLAADPAFFSVFSFPLVEGNIKSFNEGAYKIIINEKIATAYFGNAPAVGKTLKVGTRELLVVAVMKNVPGNSHLQFGFVMPMEFLKAMGWAPLDEWDNNILYTYVKFKPGANQLSFEAGIKDVIKKHVKETTSELALQPLIDIHLRSKHLSYDIPGHQDIQYVYIFISAALFILLIACINYTNLATARSMKRAKEAGLRKVAGATRGQLAVQFFSESVVYSLLAFGLAFLLSWVLLPVFNTLNGKNLTLSILSPHMLATLAIALLGCSFLAGAYPALFLSSLKPVVVFKGLLKTGQYSLFFRRALVMLQFTLGIALLLATLIIHHQLNYIHSRNIGYDKENVITFFIANKVIKQYPALKHELKELPGVIIVTVTHTDLSYLDASTDNVTWQGKDPKKNINFFWLITDHDFTKMFSIPIAEGRAFSELIASDSSAYLLNEEAVRQMGVSNVVGSTISLNDKRGLVVGIVKDFNFKPVHKKIEPMIIYINPKYFQVVAVKLKVGNIPDKVKAIEKVFKKFSPDRPFEYSFIDADIDKLYKSEQRIGQLFDYFSFVSIFISCLGLLGIIMFTTGQRSKEMAIRKVMGASSSRIFMILSKESVLLIVAANLIALPAATYWMNQWLDKFAYHETIPSYFLVGAALSSLLVTWLTISYFCLKAAQKNPVEGLRNE